MRSFTVGDLKKVLVNLSDDTIVLTDGYDHAYNLGSAEITTALVDDHGHITQDFGEDYTPEAEYGKRVKVLLIN